jgi:signal transduction histidine kinase
MSDELQFKISAGLKTVLGSDLITEDEVAIFELVKNSFDAYATKVDIFFKPESIIIADNGFGMTYEDIVNKWLFVAYSDKKNGIREEDYRNDIDKRKVFAGSKGIGRFSADRLGNILTLQTKAKSEKKEYIHKVEINWNNFDRNAKDTFEKIKVKYSNTEKFYFGLPAKYNLLFGTVLIISDLKQSWSRAQLLNMKMSLAKMINPFGEEADNFKIILHCDKELENDKKEKDKAKRREEECPSSLIVNGVVGNFVFSILKEKTTYLSVSLIDDGEKIESTLVDRGELIYHIKEKNPYESLKNILISCQLYYLNRSAKLIFSKRVGTDLIKFGSIFLFKNSFRVYPVGRENDDWWGINRRKQQGYSRFLGTRDLLGRVDVVGGEDKFKESSSRNSGFIENDYVRQLKYLFIEKCLKRIEKYVVPVTFMLSEDKYSNTISELLNDRSKANISEVIAKMIENSDVELLEYSHNLVTLINEKDSSYEESLKNIRKIAEKGNDKELLKQLDKAEIQFKKIKKERDNANKESLKEFNERLKAEDNAKKFFELAQKNEENLDEEKKRNLFLTSLSAIDKDTIVNLHHQILMYTVNINQTVENYLVKCKSNNSILISDMYRVMDKIAFLNKRIMNISKFATKANFRLESEYIREDIISYIVQYIDEIVKLEIAGMINIYIPKSKNKFITKFKPIDISIIIDNFINNSIKANAGMIRFSFTKKNEDELEIEVEDDGVGFKKTIDNLDRIFEQGFSSTNGSGLGLYHVKNVLNDIKGTIVAQRKEKNNGVIFTIRITK